MMSVEENETSSKTLERDSFIQISNDKESELTSPDETPNQIQDEDDDSVALQDLDHSKPILSLDAPLLGLENGDLASQSANHALGLEENQDKDCTKEDSNAIEDELESGSPIEDDEEQDEEEAIQSASFEPDDILEPTQNDLLDADGMGDEEDGTDVDRNDEADDTLHKGQVNLDESSAADLKDAPGSDKSNADASFLIIWHPIGMSRLGSFDAPKGHLYAAQIRELVGFKQMKPHKPVSQSRTHRDYLLDEMKCVYMDFRQERKWKLATAYTMAQWMLEWHQAVDKSTLCVKRRFTSESSMMGIIGQQSPQHIESLAVEGTDEMEVVADESGCTSDQHSINTTVSADGLVTSLLVPQCIGDNTTSTIVGTQLDPSAVGLPVVAPSAVQPVMPQCSTSRPTAKLVTLDLEANSVVPNIESVVPVSRYTMQRIVAKQPSRWNEWGCLRTQCPPVDLVKWLPLSSRYHTTPKSVSLFDSEAQVQTGVNPSQPPMTPLKLSLMKERRDKPMFDQHRMAVFAAHLRPGPIMARPSFGAASANSALQLQG
ncbi:hypothetical protein BSLG_008200 [Batrachochytrium salamandrivorans]|nr:hypothetical protein BSLG_008200 [Batrachochytrium salamandrivorans]